MEITEVRVKLNHRAADRLKAYCAVTFDDVFVVRDVKIVEGTHGLFVAMPSRKVSVSCSACRHSNPLRAHFCNSCGGKLPPRELPSDPDGRSRLHRDIAHPITTEFREHVQTVVVEAFTAEVEASGELEPAAEVESAEVESAEVESAEVEAAEVESPARPECEPEDSEDSPDDAGRDSEPGSEVEEEVEEEAEEEDDNAYKPSEYDALIADLRGETKTDQQRPDRRPTAEPRRGPQPARQEDASQGRGRRPRRRGRGAAEESREPRREPRREPPPARVPVAAEPPPERVPAAAEPPRREERPTETPASSGGFGAGIDSVDTKPVKTPPPPPQADTRAAPPPQASAAPDLGGEESVEQPAEIAADDSSAFGAGLA